jgi:hypothetical protein
LRTATSAARNESVATDKPGSVLIQRLRAVINSASRVDISNDLCPETSVTNRHYCSLILNGLAVMRARTLGTTVERIYLTPNILVSASTSYTHLVLARMHIHFPLTASSELVFLWVYGLETKWRRSMSTTHTILQLLPLGIAAAARRRRLFPAHTQLFGFSSSQKKLR